MSEKAGNNFWDLDNNNLIKFPSRITKPFGIEFVAELPEELQGDKRLGMVAHKDDAGKDYIIFVRVDGYPMRFNIEKNIFEKMESTDDGRWEWREY